MKSAAAIDAILVATGERIEDHPRVQAILEEVSALRERLGAKKLLKAKEVAEICSVDPKTVSNWKRSGVLETVKIGETERFRLEDIEQLLCREVVA